jgi:hypothetical protein
MGHRVRRSTSFLSLLFFGVLCPAAFLLLCASPALGQTTQVTGQVLDVNNIPYAAAQMKAQLVFAGTPVSNPTVTISVLSQCIANGFGSAPCQVPFTPSNGPFNLDSGGNIPGGGITLQDNTQVTPSGTTWAFTVNTAGTPPPLGTGPQTCNATLTISGANQSISSSFSACPKLSNAGLPGGSNGQLQYNKNGVTSGVQNTTVNASGFMSNLQVGNAAPAVNGSISVVAGSSSTYFLLTALDSSGHAFFGLETQSSGPDLVQIGAGAHIVEPTGSSNNDVSGKVTCSSGTVTKTFATAYTSTPVVVLSDETTAGGAKTSPSNTGFTVTCTGASDVVDYLVFGNPN